LTPPSIKSPSVYRHCHRWRYDNNNPNEIAQTQEDHLLSKRRTKEGIITGVREVIE